MEKVATDSPCTSLSPRQDGEGGTVAVIHSYTGDTNWFLQLTAILLAESGFATCAIDHQGHGLSEGLQNHIPDINPVVDDCVSFLDSFRFQYPATLPSFLYAESLGGAIALLIHLRGKQPDSSSRPWDGVVLNAAICGVSDKITPPWPVEKLLSLVATVAPTWEIVPTKVNSVELSYKEEWKRKLRLACPTRSTAKPRAATAVELLRVSRELQGRLEEVDLPLLIVHAKELYRRAASEDKTLRIYPGMLHQIIGEPQENVDLVFGEIVNWLLTRAEHKAAAPPVSV
ncbi:hypothetical protein NE237_004556 [Protea cynaroides]|uniref:Serine aminopeptidase S33 domain-containing protein n=1 Tax=Protea cynaroides TaxID=273540 RepID=A0A9Q0QTQ2_9MAGN|nr:hypothetical protein NE237_004556 [Protea cynaroides]